MAEKSFITKDSDVSKQWAFGFITGTATANKLVDADTTEALSIRGVRKFRASGTYVKGSSTNGKIELIVDGVVRATSSVSTTDGEVLTCEWTGPCASSAYIKATITGTATGASVNYAALSHTQPQY